MFSLYFVLLSFSESLVTKFLFLNDESCMVRPAVIDTNSNQLKYYPFMISLNKYSGNYNAFSPKMSVPKEIKDINVKAVNMIRNNDEAKAMAEYISGDCKYKFNRTTCSSKQKWNSKKC